MCTFQKVFKINPTEELKPISIQKNTSYHFDIVKDKLFNCVILIYKKFLYFGKMGHLHYSYFGYCPHLHEYTDLGKLERILHSFHSITYI